MEAPEGASESKGFGRGRGGIQSTPPAPSFLATIRSTQPARPPPPRLQRFAVRVHPVHWVHQDHLVQATARPAERALTA
jgi:hypothetical protein